MNFNGFNFDPTITKAILTCGFSTPTNIQQQAIPHLLKGHDLLGLAQTGTGKTAAFALPTIQKLNKGARKKIKALILTPTRELAEQVHNNFQQLSQGTGLRSCAIYGGVSKATQLKKIAQGVEILVACPGRLLDLLNSRSIELSGIETLILDEADQMFDKGFLPDIRRILSRVPKKRQTMVFSATMPTEIRHFAEEVLKDPVTVQVDQQKPATTISHALFQIDQNRKTLLLKQLLKEKDVTTTLVFTRTKHKAKSLARQLFQDGFKVTSLQGNLSQNQRTKALEGFRSGQFNIMVATDIAARGIDVSGISHVVNYDVPDTVEAYIHRTGRTGRAQKEGMAYTFATPEDSRIIRMVEHSIGKSIHLRTVPGLNDSETVKKPTETIRTNKPRRKSTSSIFGLSAR